MLGAVVFCKHRLTKATYTKALAMNATEPKTQYAIAVFVTTDHTWCKWMESARATNNVTIFSLRRHRCRGVLCGRLIAVSLLLQFCLVGKCIAPAELSTTAWLRVASVEILTAYHRIAAVRLLYRPPAARAQATMLLLPLLVLRELRVPLNAVLQSLHLRAILLQADIVLLQVTLVLPPVLQIRCFELSAAKIPLSASRHPLKPLLTKLRHLLAISMEVVWCLSTPSAEGRRSTRAFIASRWPIQKYNRGIVATCLLTANYNFLLTMSLLCGSQSVDSIAKLLLTKGFHSIVCGIDCYKICFFQLEAATNKWASRENSRLNMVAHAVMAELMVSLRALPSRHLLLGKADLTFPLGLSILEWYACLTSHSNDCQKVLHDFNASLLKLSMQLCLILIRD
jgi:hypothetical protein